MSDYIKREDVLDFLNGIYDCNDMVFKNDICDRTADCSSCRWRDTKAFIASRIARFPAADVVERKSNKPKTNADRIRSMTDKELAVWLAGAMLYGEPLKVMRIADWEKWLKQESKEWNLT